MIAKQRRAQKLTPKLWILFALVFTLFSEAASALPYSLSYSGRITKDYGAPIEGPVDIEIKFFRSELNQDEIAVSSLLPFLNTELDEGVFVVNIELSPTDFNTVFNGTDAVWIQVRDLTNNNTFPRQVFSVVPYALKIPVDGTSLTYNSEGKLQVGQVPATSVAGSNGSSGQILTSNGSGGMSWQTASGTYPAPDAAKVGFISVASSINLDAISPSKMAQDANNQFVTAIDKTAWNAKQAAGSYITALTGDVTASGPNSASATIANDAITPAKLATGAVTFAKIDGTGCSDGNVLQRSGSNWTCGTPTASNVSGVVAVSNGGTGQGTLTSGAILLGNGTSGISSTGPGTSGQIPISTGSTISMASMSGDAAIASNGTLTIAANAVTSTKLQSDGATDANRAVTTNHVKDAAVTNAKIATGIDAAKITTGTIPYAQLPVGTTANKVAAGDDTRFTDARTPTGSAGGDLSGSYPSPTIAAATVTGKALTGFSSTTGTISASDTILSAINKLDGSKASGPASSTTNAIARYSDTTGKVLKNSGVVVDDSGNVGIGTTSPVTPLDINGSATLRQAYFESVGALGTLGCGPTNITGFSTNIYTLTACSSGTATMNIGTVSGWPSGAMAWTISFFVTGATSSVFNVSYGGATTAVYWDKNSTNGFGGNNFAGISVPSGKTSLATCVVLNSGSVRVFCGVAAQY